MSNSVKSIFAYHLHISPLLNEGVKNALSYNFTKEYFSARVEYDVDYWGADIRNFRSRGLRDCYNHCRRQRGCVSFTMRKNDKHCWLKKRRNGARRHTNRRHLISANMVVRPAGATNVRITARWQSIPGRLTRISRGRAGTWGVNRHGHIFKLNSNGNLYKCS